MSKDVHTNESDVPFDSPERRLGVLVGFDGSASSIAALKYGARIARRRGTALTVVNAYSIPPSMYAAPSAAPERHEAQERVEASERFLEEARKHLRDYSGEVTYRSEAGDAAGVMVELSSDAQLAVVGARGRGGFLGRILGSVASGLPGHSHCPTIVVPREFQTEEEGGDASSTRDRTHAPVVVGVDSSRESRAALLQAAEAAEERETSLQLTMALPLPGTLLWYPELKDSDLLERRAAQLKDFLDEEDQWLAQHYPSLKVTTLLEPGDPIAVMSKETSAAQLTVLGTHGRGNFSGAVLGSVSRGVLLKAKGPVMVVPFLEDPRIDGTAAPSSDL
jgi:nucleotide-binding universal stress UspA family protein